MDRQYKVLLIDHKDSFVYNLARYFRNIGCEAIVRRVDNLPTVPMISQQFHLVVLSPGPCRPQDAGTVSLVKDLVGRVAILGVCLGHQVIGEAFGAQVVRLSQPVHGEASLMWHDGLGEFSALPVPLLVGRYHSLVIDATSIPSGFKVSGWLKDGTVMAIRHATLPIVGWQFHPESVLTPHGYRLLRQFLKWTGSSTAAGPVRTPQAASASL